MGNLTIDNFYEDLNDNVNGAFSEHVNSLPSNLNSTRTELCPSHINIATIGDKSKEEACTTKCIYRYDFLRSRVSIDDKITPKTKIISVESTKFTKRQLRRYSRVMGYWHLNRSNKDVEEIFEKLKIGTREGHFFKCLIDMELEHGYITIKIYTEHSNNKENIFQVLQYINDFGISLPEIRIRYFTEYKNDVLYTSEGDSYKLDGDSCKLEGNSYKLDGGSYKLEVDEKKSGCDGKGEACTTKCIYKYNCLEGTAIKDDKITPKTKIISVESTKFTRKRLKRYRHVIGYWHINRSNKDVEEIFEKLKTGTREGHFFKCRIDIELEHISIKIYTEHFNDKENIFKVLQYIHDFGISLPKKCIRYFTEYKNDVLYTSEEDSYNFEADEKKSGSDEKGGACTTKCVYKYDFLEGTAIKDDKITPKTKIISVGSTKFTKQQLKKYSRVMGYWHINRSNKDVEEIFEKLKIGTREGHFFKCLIDMELEQGYINIKIYTEHFNNKENIFKVLQYIHDFGISLPETCIRYFTEYKNDVLYTSEENSYIFKSNEKKSGSDEKGGKAKICIFKFDSQKNKVARSDRIKEHTLRIFVTNTKYDKNFIKSHLSYTGFWSSYKKLNHNKEVNEIYKKLKVGVREGILWRCSLIRLVKQGHIILRIHIFCINCFDKSDLVNILDFMNDKDLLPANKKIPFIMEKAKSRMYDSINLMKEFKNMDMDAKSNNNSSGSNENSPVRSQGLSNCSPKNLRKTHEAGSKISGTSGINNRVSLTTYKYDINCHKVITMCTGLPSNSKCLVAENNLYNCRCKQYRSVGRWILSVSKAKTSVANYTWIKIKEGIKSGQLWKATAKNTVADITFAVDTFDLHNRKEVKRVLYYLQDNDIKPEDQTIFYKGYMSRGILYMSDDFQNQNVAEHDSSSDDLSESSCDSDDSSTTNDDD